MKRYTELTNEELVALTSDQTNLLIDYECALEGVPMLPPHPGPSPFVETPKAEQQLYKVGGVITTDNQHAMAILNTMIAGPLVKEEHPDGDYNFTYPVFLTEKSYGYPKIESESCYTKEQYEALKDRRKEQVAAKKEYDRELNLYNKAADHRKDIVKAVVGAVDEARRVLSEIDSISSKFEYYLKLAEGSAQVAMNFLIKAHPDVEECYPELVQELCPGYGVEVEKPTPARISAEIDAIDETF